MLSSASRKKMNSGFSPLAQGLTLARCRAQLEDVRDASLTVELNLSTLRHVQGLVWVVWGIK